MRRPSTHLAATLGLTVAILWVALSASAQSLGKVPHIGYLWLGPEGSDRATMKPGFQQGLRELGYQEGRDIIIEYRYADGSGEKLRQLVADTVASKVDIILAAGVIVATTVKEATTNIPVVAVAGDPIASGLVDSLAHPGGNITGLSAMVPEFGGKFTQLLHEIVPDAVRIGVLWNPLNGASQTLVREIRDATAHFGLNLKLYEVRQPGDFQAVFDAIAEQSPDALMVDTDVLLISQRKGIADFAAAHRLSAVYGLREFAEAGGLISYGPSTFDLWRRAARYVDQILKGLKPADLPVEQPTKFELVINLKTANALGLTIPPLVLARADEVIE